MKPTSSSAAHRMIRILSPVSIIVAVAADGAKYIDAGLDCTLITN